MNHTKSTAPDEAGGLERGLFEALVREHGSRLSLFLSAAVPDPLVREELLQETLLVAWRRLVDFDPERNFGAWLRGIATRLVLARRRADGRRGPTLDPAVLEQLDQLCEAPEGRAGDWGAVEVEALRVCLARLGDRERELVERRYSEGRRGADLAAALGRSVEGTRKALQRVRARLHECVSGRLALEVRP